MMRLRRCDQCCKGNVAWCGHHRVLRLFMGGAPVLVRSESEQAARTTADRLSVAFRGRPFHRRDMIPADS